MIINGTYRVDTLVLNDTGTCEDPIRKVCYGTHTIEIVVINEILENDNTTYLIQHTVSLYIIQYRITSR